MINPYSNGQAGGPPNPMMTAPRSPGFKDAQTSYGGGQVNTQTQGLNPYVQFQPNRMDQLWSLLGQRRGGAAQPQPQKQLQHTEGPRFNPQQMQQPQDEWVDVPAMNRLGFSVGSATTRVKKNSQAAQNSGLGVVGY